MEGDGRVLLRTVFVFSQDHVRWQVLLRMPAYYVE